jgi:predicted transcriptional regulator
MLILTGEQIKAGRALCRVNQTELARRAGVSLETIKRLEAIRGEVDANVRTLNAILNAFADLGVTFECDEGRTGLGVRARPGGSREAAGGAPA